MASGRCYCHDPGGVSYSSASHAVTHTYSISYTYSNSCHTDAYFHTYRHRDTHLCR